MKKTKAAKDHIIYVRTTKAEFDSLVKRAKGNVSKFVRQQLFKTKTVK